MVSEQNPTTTAKNWLKSKLTSLKRTANFTFSEDVFISILLCLVSGDKHLILTSRQEELEDLRTMTEQIFPHIFGLSCSTITCDITQTPTDFTTCLFNRPREENPPGNGDGGITIEESTIHSRITSQKSLRSIRTINSTYSTDNGKKSNKKAPAKRRSNYSHISTHSTTSNHTTKDSLSSDFTDGLVTEEPQTIVGTEYDESVPPILVVDNNHNGHNNNGKGGGNDVSEKLFFCVGSVAAAIRIESNLLMGWSIVKGMDQADG
ncbi:12076_t:CDS:2 [Ambispora gerdemannii]|uniref:12076_t:CDS:1 n=1 Tax=Ambispora gerdemannii TaxID=144530 RepID=A0A9N9A5W1_9GLOM|nr:12076_t:CDS:2 [Ambispora gerdemannii]